MGNKSEQYCPYFPDAGVGDMCVIFNLAAKHGELPVDHAFVKTNDIFMGDNFEELDVSMCELGSGILVTVWPDPCDPPSLPPGEGPNSDMTCRFHRNGDANSNFFTADIGSPSEGRLWIHNTGDRSLRFQIRNGPIYRVHAGCTQVLDGDDPQARIGAAQILLDLGGNALDYLISAVHVRYGASPWMRGEADCTCASRPYRYFHRVFCGDDCLGVLEAAGGDHVPVLLAPLDLQSYGPSRWFVRNRNTAPIPLDRPGGGPIPADGCVYSLEALMGRGEDA